MHVCNQRQAGPSPERFRLYGPGVRRVVPADPVASSGQFGCEASRNLYGLIGLHRDRWPIGGRSRRQLK